MNAWMYTMLLEVSPKWFAKRLAGVYTGTVPKWVGPARDSVYGANRTVFDKYGKTGSQRVIDLTQRVQKHVKNRFGARGELEFVKNGPPFSDQKVAIKRLQSKLDREGVFARNVSSKSLQKSVAKLDAALKKYNAGG